MSPLTWGNRRWHLLAIASAVAVVLVAFAHTPWWAACSGAAAVVLAALVDDISGLWGGES